MTKKIDINEFTIKKYVESIRPKKTDTIEQLPSLNGLLFNIINLEKPFHKQVDLPFAISCYCIASKQK